MTYVGPEDEIDRYDAAILTWGIDLEIDNIDLFRAITGGPYTSRHDGPFDDSCNFPLVP